MNLAQRLQDRHSFQRCGLQVFDLTSHKLTHWLHITGAVSELYDVVYLPEKARPYTTGFSEPHINMKRVFFPAQ
ncbi:MAG: TIGR03032 family protein [Methylovulum sp.]|nr:TIGR03032 family protein [Methylovulum sp.]